MPNIANNMGGLMCQITEAANDLALRPTTEAEYRSSRAGTGYSTEVYRQSPRCGSVAPSDATISRRTKEQNLELMDFTVTT